MTNLESHTETTEIAVIENSMGTQPVGKLILQMSLPMMFSMLVQSLYNIVDSIFVARLSEDALTAVTFAMPLQSIMTAVTVGLSVGVNAVLSKFLGEKDQDGVNRSAGNGLLMEWACFLLFFLIGVFGVEPFFALQGASEQIVQYGVAYTRIVCIFSFGVVNQVIMERLLISTGKTLGSMASLFTGAVVNMILDPILIFGLFGFPALGIAGAAWATVIAQTVAASLGTTLNLTVNREIQFRRKSFRPDAALMGGILKIGFPAMLSNAANSLVTFGMNRILLSFTSTATAVYGVYVRLQGFALMPIYGLRNTIVSILAYNYGAKHKSRLRQAIRICLITSVSITVVLMGVFLFLPGALLSLFDAQEGMLAIGTPALRIISIGIPMTGISTILGAVFQSFGDSSKELAISMTRMAVLLLSAWVLSGTGKLEIVWWAFVITEVAALILAVIFWSRVNVKFIKPIAIVGKPVKKRRMKMKRKMFFMLGVVLGMISVTAYASQGREGIVQSEQLRVEKSVNPGSVVTAAQNASDPSDRKDEETSRILIAYFTRADNIVDPSGLDAVSSASLNLNNGEIEGNMEYLAKNIQSLTDGDLFSIQTEASYSQNYRETTAQARQEQRSGERPVLKTHVENMADYDVIYIGYPNWWGTIPMPIYAFLEEYDLKGKIIIPFCSHEGSGLGSSVSDIKAACPDSDILNGFAVRGSRATLSETSAEMEEWLREIGQL